MTKKNQPLKATDNQYYDLIRRAAILQREFLGVNQTESFKKDRKGEAIYVLDTDIFACYANSLLKGPLTGVNRNGYGQLLPRRYDIRSLSEIEDEGKRREVKSTRFKEDHNAVVLSRWLARAALDRGKTTLKGKGLYLQLNPHFKETNRMLATVKSKVSDFDEQKAKSQRENLRKNVRIAFNVLSKTLSNTTKNARRPTINRLLGFLVDQIMHREMLSETGSFYEADNYNELGLWKDEDKGRMPLSEFSEIHTSAFYSFTESQHRTARPVLRLLWDDLLANVKTKGKQRKPDVEALTELTILNKHLFRSTCDWGETPVRVVFLTGDIGLLDACYRAPDKLFRQLRHYIMHAFPDADQAEVGRKQTELEQYFGFDRSNSESKWFDRFSLHYVRHIRAFSREVLFERTGQSDEHLGDIFDGLFAAEARKLMRSRRSMERLAQFPREKDKPDDLDKDFDQTLQKWNSLVTHAVGRGGLDRWVKKAGDSQIIQEVTTKIVSGDGSDIDWDTVMDWLFEYVDRGKDDTMLSLSGLGAETLGKIEVTYPPDLYFDSLTNCKHIFKELAITPGYLKSNSLVKDFAKIVKDCNDEKSDDPDRRWEHHLRFLVLGAVFASAQKWSAAEEHARRAIDIIERAPKLGEEGKIHTKKKKSNPSGREAYFLRTVCARIRSQNSDNLNEASEYLEKARDAFKKDLGVEKNHPLEELIWARFRNERLSIALAQYYQARRDIDNETSAKRADVESGISETKKSGENESSGERIEAVCNELSSSWCELVDGSDISDFLNPGNDFPEQLTGMYIALNILQLATISEFWNEEKGNGNSHAWKINIENTITPETKWIEKAYLFLKSANSNDNSLRSTKMGKAYEVSGALLLNETLPEDFDNMDAVKVLFHELRLELRANYDEWRVEKLEAFILAGINKLDRHA